MEEKTKKRVRKPSDDRQCFVYILGSSGTGGLRTYVGWTTDLARRLTQHNNGRGARSTRGRIWVLLYAERLDTTRDAMRREWRLKRDRPFRKRLLEIIEITPTAR